MGALVRRILIVATLSLGALSLAQSAGRAAFSIKFPLFHRASHDWKQFRLGPDNNAVIGGRTEASWRIETGAQVSSSPTFVDGVVYVGNNGGRLYAIDLDSGKVLWTLHVRNPLMSAPIVSGDLLFVGEGDATSMGSSPSEPMVVGQGPSALVAVERRTGRVRWSKTLTGSAMPTPAIVDGVLVHHNGAGWVVGLDPSSGKKIFTHHLDSMASMTAILPVGQGQFVTAGVGTNAAWRMSASDGSVVWRSLFPPGVSGLGDCPPVSDGTRVYCNYVAPVPPDKATAVGNKAVQRAYALDLTTGAPRWDVALETGTLPPRNEAAIPVLVNGVLCMGSALAPVMHGIDPSTGRLLWSVKTHGPIKGGSAVVDGTLYFGDHGGYLWAVDVQTGNVTGSKAMHVPFNVGSPLVVGRTLIVGSDGGTILAVPLAQIRSAHDA